RCEKYLPLARSIARKYRGRGVHAKDLSSAAEFGLAIASRKFDPAKGAFPPYAKFWITGEITRLFKPTSDAVGQPNVSLDTSVGSEDETFTLHEVIPDDRTEIPCPDISGLSSREKRVLVGTVAGETLEEIGAELGVSQERVRQINVAAAKKA